METHRLCIGNSKPLYLDITKKLSVIEEILNLTIIKLEQDDIEILNDFEEISKSLGDLETIISTYLLNCLLSEYTDSSKQVSNSIHKLSSKKQGALIVIEKDDPVLPYISDGTPINAQISSALLESIFQEESTLKNGAVLIKSNLIVSAANKLPLTEQIFWDRMFDYREISAIGLSERCDALILLIYENGTTSFSLDGNIYPFSRHQKQ